MVLIRPFPVPQDGIRYQNSSVEAVVGPNNHGKGTLYISEEIISWINSSTGEGFTIPYKRMTCHAISRDPSVHTSHCLYIMVNGLLGEEDGEDEEGNVPVAEDDDDEMTEIRFIPDDANALEILYRTVEDCSLLHPDAVSDMSADEDSNEDFNPEAYVAEEDEEEEEGEGDQIRGINWEPADQLQDQERQFGNLQLYLANRLNLGQNGGAGGGDGQAASNGNANGNPHPSQPPFDPDQFADADE